MFPSRKRPRYLLPAMLGALSLVAGTVTADDAIERHASHAHPSQLDIQALAPVGTDTLNEQRARQGVSNVQLGQVHSQIALHDNVVVGGHGGTNLIANGAFDNARGFSTIIQNTGHNVAIQESMIVNVTINP